MTRARTASTVAAAFVVSQILAIAVHGFILAGDYGPFYGTLLRSQQEAPWRMLLLPLSHLAFISALVWVFTHVRLEGSSFARGLQIGALGWMMGQVPLWLLWYAEQPWPGDLVVKQLVLELLSSLVIGVTIAVVGTPYSSRSTVAG